jgi:drug/metabolite transporter (DMT)-like permease
VAARAGTRDGGVRRRRSLVGAALATTWITTGGNFLAFKWALTEIPPNALMFARLAVAGGLLLTVGLAAGARSRPTPRQLGAAAFSGVLLLALGQGGIVWGVRALPSGKTAVLAASAPIFVALFSWVVLRAPLRWQTGTGIVVGFAGLALMGAGGHGGAVALGPALLVVGGSAFWAAGAIYAHRARLPDNILLSGGVQMLVAAGVFLVPAAGQGELSRIDPVAWRGSTLAGFGYLALVGLALGYGAYAWLNQTVSPALANTFQYVSPVVALAAGAWLLSEPVGATDVAAATLTLAGVALMVSASPGTQRSTRSRSQEEPMPNRTNHRLVHRAYEAFNARDAAAALATLHDQVSWDDGEGHMLSGHLAVRDHWQQQWSAVSPTIEIIDLRDTRQGTQARVRLSLRKDGNVQSREIINDLQFRDGLISSMRISPDTSNT